MRIFIFKDFSHLFFVVKWLKLFNILLFISDNREHIISRYLDHLLFQNMIQILIIWNISSLEDSRSGNLLIFHITTMFEVRKLILGMIKSNLEEKYDWNICDFYLAWGIIGSNRTRTSIWFVYGIERLRCYWI